MDNFDNQMMQAIQKALLKFFSQENWIMPDYHNRVKIPASIAQEAWNMVDQNALKRALAERLQKELADRLVNHIATEIATDVKQILSDKEQRERIRAVCREHLISLTATEAK